MRILTAPVRWLAARFYLRRCRLGRRVGLRGRPAVNATGTIDLGDNVRVWSHLARTQLSAGKEATLRVGEGTFINAGTTLSARSHIDIGRRCQIARDVVVMDADFHGVDDRDSSGKTAPIVIEDDVWLATRALVLKGVRIGKGAVVAAGAVVTKDVEPYTLVAGVPAKVVRRLSV